MPVLSCQPLDVVVCFIFQDITYTFPHGSRAGNSHRGVKWLFPGSSTIPFASIALLSLSRVLAVGGVGHFYRDIRVRTGPFTTEGGAWTLYNPDTYF